MDVDEQAQVVPEALHDEDDAGMQRAELAGAVLAPGVPPQRRHDAVGEASADGSEPFGVVAEPNRHGAFEGQDPLAVRHGGQAMVDHERGALGHAAADARRADTAALAGERDAQLLGAAAALHDDEAAAKVAAGEQRRQLARDEVRQGSAAVLETLHERGQVLAHDRQGVGRLGLARNVDASVAAGQCLDDQILPSQRRCIEDAYMREPEASKLYLGCFVPLIDELGTCLDDKLECTDPATTDACFDDFDIGARSCIDLPQPVKRGLEDC